MSRVEVQETNSMIREMNLDVRTITMGISLMDCAHEDMNVFNRNIYDKITRSAEHLVKTGEDLEKQFGVPIVNKRISVTPISIAAGGLKTGTFVPVAEALDRAAKEVGVNFIGGFSALVQKGFTNGDRVLINSIPEALAVTDRVCSSVNVGSSRSGINMDAVKQMGDIIIRTAERTADRGSIGCAKLVVFCNAVEDNPFMAGAFHGVGEQECVINVGVSGPGVVKRALEEVKGKDFETLCETIKRTAFKVTRVGQLVAQEASKRLGVPFGIIDLSLAPTPEIGDSIAEIFQVMGLEEAGAPGTTAALAILNDNVKKGGVMASSYVGGLSGAFIPVSEDHGMIEAVQRGALTLEKLEAMTCVCSVGLDMIAIPGSTRAATISGIIADEAAIGMVNNKTTAVRIIPVIGKDVGEIVEFGGLLGYAPIMPVNAFNCAPFIERGGRIPAPIHSFKN
nr:PFL family protein [Paenibacillus sp. J53TS2]